MTVTLTTVDADAFGTYLELATIWPEPYNQMAREACIEDANTGEVFYIKYNDQVVGITGLFDDPEFAKDICLRWHGVLPTHRRLGIGEAALFRLLQEVKPKIYPSRKRIIEFIPCTEYGLALRPFFSRCGFNGYGPLVDLGYGGHLWKPVYLTTWL